MSETHDESVDREQARDERAEKNRALKRALDELDEFSARLAKALKERDEARRELAASRARHKQLADLVMEVTGEAVDVTITRMEEGR